VNANAPKHMEAWVAGHFALGLKKTYPPIEVRIILDRESHDFELRIGRKEHKFEATTAYYPERKMSDEYKDRERLPLQPRPYQKPGLGEVEGSLWIAKVVKSKYEKHYAESSHLLVYANFNADYLDPRELAKSCQKWSQSFLSIWIFWIRNYLLLYNNSDVFKEVAFRTWVDTPVSPWG